MEHAVAERYPEIVLECVSDFLVPTSGNVA
jgi:hypothetical protein